MNLLVLWQSTIEFCKKYAWLLGLAIGTYIIYLLTNAYVEHQIYSQPKVTIITNTIIKETVRDRSVTTKYKIVRPDGTIEEHETIQAAIDSFKDQEANSTNVSEPIAVKVKASSWGLGAGYEPWQHEFLAKVDYTVASFDISLTHPLGYIEGDSLHFTNEIRPAIFLTWKP